MMPSSPDNGHLTYLSANSAPLVCARLRSYRNGLHAIGSIQLTSGPLGRRCVATKSDGIWRAIAISFQ